MKTNEIECLHGRGKKFWNAPTTLSSSNVMGSFVNKLWNEILHKIIIFPFTPELCDLLLLFFHILGRGEKKKTKMKKCSLISTSSYINSRKKHSSHRAYIIYYCLYTISFCSFLICLSPTSPTSPTFKSHIELSSRLYEDFYLNFKWF